MKRTLVRFTLSSALIWCLAHNPAAHADEHGHEHGSEEGEGSHDEHGVKLDEETLVASRVTTETVGAAKLATTLRLNGQVVPLEDKTAHLIPRFSGIVREVRKTLGDHVSEGETVAVIESNQSLTPYEVRSLIAGTVTRRHVTRGEYASDSTEIFEVIDLSEVYATFFVFASDLDKIRQGQKVILTYQQQQLRGEARVSLISPLIDDATQSKFVRVRIDNRDQKLSPGAFLTGDIVLDENVVPLAVKASAIQSHEGKAVVFVREGEGFEPRAVQIGRSDGLVTEILDGLTQGETYAAGNTFILKAEIGKASAEHEH